VHAHFFVEKNQRHTASKTPQSANTFAENQAKTRPILAAHGIAAKTIANREIAFHNFKKKCQTNEKVPVEHLLIPFFH
jgi:hypothetical protein